MRSQEVVGKILAFGIVGGALVVGGILVFVGPHQPTDIGNTILGITLVGLGGITLVIGAVTVAAILHAEKLTRREEAVHLTPRSGPPAAPPTWGMSNVGRPGHGIVEVGRIDKGDVRVMVAHLSRIDAPLLIIGLLAWTAIALVFLAPK